MEQSTRLAFVHQSQLFHPTVQGTSTTCPRFSKARSIGSLIPIRNNIELGTETSATEQKIVHAATRTRYYFRVGSEAQLALRERSAHKADKQTQLVEGETQIHFFLHQMESEQRAPMMILESVSQNREIVRQEAQHFRGVYQRLDSVAQLSICS